MCMNSVARTLQLLDLFTMQQCFVSLHFLRGVKVSPYTNSLHIEQHPMENRTDTREDKSVSKSFPSQPQRVDSHKLT